MTQYTLTTPSAHRVKDVPERQRPRELFERLGPKGVSEEVLLAILLRTGTTGLNVVDLARDLLVRYGSLTGLAETPAAELRRVKGMGRVKAQILVSALELAKRLADERSPVRSEISSPEDVARMFREDARVREEETFWVVPLDSRNRIVRAPVEVTRGLVNATLVHPREVFKEAVRAGATALMLCHNHPTGDPSPSPEDIRITRQMVEAGGVLDIRVLDHIIVGRASAGNPEWFTSIRQSGLVAFRD